MPVSPTTGQIIDESGRATGLPVVNPLELEREKYTASLKAGAANAYDFGYPKQSVSTLSSLEGEKTVKNMMNTVNPPPKPETTTGKDTTSKPAGTAAATSPTEETMLKNEMEASETPNQKIAREAKERADKEKSDLKTTLDPIRQQADVARQAQLDQIEREYASVIAKRQEINRRNEKTSETIQIRGGTARYASEAAMGAVDQVVSEGEAKLSELYSKKAAARANVEAAYNEKKYTLALKEFDSFKEIDNEMNRTINKLNEDLVKANKEIAEEERLMTQESVVQKTLDSLMQGGQMPDRNKIVQALGGKIPSKVIDDYLDRLQEETGATSADFNDLTILLGRNPTLAEIVEYRQAKAKPTVKEYVIRMSDGKLHRVRDVVDATGNVLGTTDLGEAGSTILDELRTLQLEDKTSVSPGQLVNASTGRPLTTGNQAMKDRAVNLKGLQTQIGNIEKKVEEGIKTGAVSGWITYNGITVPALQETLDPKMLELQAEMIGLFTRYVYAMTGAQVNELEFAQASRITPSVKSTPENNKAIIKGFKSNIGNQLDSILKGEGWKFAEQGSSQGGEQKGETAKTLQDRAQSAGYDYAKMKEKYTDEQIDAALKAKGL